MAPGNVVRVTRAGWKQGALRQFSKGQESSEE